MVLESRLQAPSVGSNGLDRLRSGIRRRDVGSTLSAPLSDSFEVHGPNAQSQNCRGFP
jgi:hypothetical protein